jgi:hypothetical protein
MQGKSEETKIFGILSELWDKLNHSEDLLQSVDFELLLGRILCWPFHHV